MRNPYCAIDQFLQQNPTLPPLSVEAKAVIAIHWMQMKHGRRNFYHLIGNPMGFDGEGEKPEVIYAEGTKLLGVSSLDWTCSSFAAQILPVYKNRFCRLLFAFLEVFFRHNLSNRGVGLCFSCRLPMVNKETGVIYEIHSESFVLHWDRNGRPVLLLSHFYILNPWSKDDLPILQNPTLDFNGKEERVLEKLEEVILEVAQKNYLHEIGISQRKIQVLQCLIKKNNIRTIAALTQEAESTVALDNREILQFFKVNFSTFFSTAKECAVFITRMKLF